MHCRDPLRTDDIRLGQRDGAAIKPEKADDFEMLTRLRHDPVIGSDDEEDAVETVRAGKHRVDEALMSRHIDETDHAAVACGQ